MGDYRENPAAATSRYSLFLVRNPQALTMEVMEDLHKATLKDKLILSFERLYKGAKSALVVYGPLSILQPLISQLELLELEEYSRKLEPNQIQAGALAPNALDGVMAWEVGSKRAPHEILEVRDLINQVPQLGEHEEFWWQVVVQPVSSSSGNSLLGFLGSSKQTGEKFNKSHFNSIIRVVLLTESKKRAQSLQEQLAKLGSKEGLALLPQPYSTLQIVKFYQDRSLPHKTSSIAGKGVYPVLTVSELRSLIF